MLKGVLLVSPSNNSAEACHILRHYERSFCFLRIFDGLSSLPTRIIYPMLPYFISEGKLAKSLLAPVEKISLDTARNLCNILGAERSFDSENATQGSRSIPSNSAPIFITDTCPQLSLQFVPSAPHAQCTKVFIPVENATTDLSSRNPNWTSGFSFLSLKYASIRRANSSNVCVRS